MLEVLASKQGYPETRKGLPLHLFKRDFSFVFAASIFHSRHSAFIDEKKYNQLSKNYYLKYITCVTRDTVQSSLLSLGFIAFWMHI